MNIHETIEKRRTVYPKHFTGEKIPDEKVKQLLENANWAPTHRYTEPWRFQVFKADALIRLNNFMKELYLQKTPPEAIQQRKLNKFQDIPQKVSHILAIIMKRDEKESIPEIEEICSVACAVQNIYLSLSDLNLAGYWSTGNGTYDLEMKNYLKIPEEDRLMGFFFLGLPKRIPAKGIRKPIENKVIWFDK